MRIGLQQTGKKVTNSEIGVDLNTNKYDDDDDDL